MDETLCHALLNSVLMKFFVEAVGFGRGLCVLDVNKESISNCFMLNPSLLSEVAIKKIKEKFSVVLGKDIMSVDDELKDKDWIDFNRTILRSFGLEDYYLRISNSLLSMRQVRYTARSEVRKGATLKDINKQEKRENAATLPTVSMAAESRKIN